jgi:hypothetical protein
VSVRYTGWGGCKWRWRTENTRFGKKLTAIVGPFVIYWYYGKPPCPHKWRPCVVNSYTYGEQKPARICDICKDWQPLTPEQFYAQFGESFYAAARWGKRGASS